MSQQYGKVDSALVDHHHFRALSRDAQTICLFVRCTGRCNAIGCYLYPISHLADDIGMTMEEASKALPELSERGYLQYCDVTRWVWIPKHLVRFPVRGKNSGKHALDVLETVPREFQFTSGLVAVFEENHDWSGDKESGKLDDRWEAIKRALEGPSKGDTSRAISESLSVSTNNHNQDPLSGKPDPAKKKLLSMDEVRDVFEHWQTVCEHPKAVLSEDRTRAIRRAGKHYTVGQMKLAIDGCAVTPHNQGQNDRGEKYDSIELILRDSEHVERFMRNAENPPQAVRRVNGRGERFVVDGEEVWLPQNIESNDKEILALARRFRVKTQGVSRNALQDKLRKALERAEQGSPA